VISGFPVEVIEYVTFGSYNDVSGFELEDAMLCVDGCVEEPKVAMGLGLFARLAGGVKPSSLRMAKDVTAWLVACATFMRDVVRIAVDNGIARDDPQIRAGLDA
jgi:hypothetical protein